MTKKVKVHRVLKKETRKLPVRLGDAEILETSRKAAALDQKIKDLEDQEERSKADGTASKKKAEMLEGDRRKLQLIVRQGSEDRDVEVITLGNMRTGTAREIRTDTQEVISERNMTVEESQGVMFTDIEAGGAEEDDPIDVTPKALPKHHPKGEEGEANV